MGSYKEVGGSQVPLACRVDGANDPVSHWCRTVRGKLPGRVLGELWDSGLKGMAGVG